MDRSDSTMDDFREQIKEFLCNIKEMTSLIKSHISPTTCVLSVSAGLAVYWLIRRNRYRLPPGPLALPLVGNYSLLGDQMLHETCAKLSNQYGPVITIQIGPMRMVVLNTIEAVTEAMVTKGTDFANRPVTVSGNMISEGGSDILLSQYTPSLKIHRKIATKALRMYLRGDKQEKAVFASMNEFISLLTNINGKPFTPHAYINHVIFNVMCSLCFNKVYNFDDKTFTHFVGKDDEFIKEFGLGFIEDVFPILVKIWPSERYRKMAGLWEEVFQFIKEEFQEHLLKYNTDDIKDVTDFVIQTRKEAEGDVEDEELLSQLTDVHLRQTVSDIFFGKTIEHYWSAANSRLEYTSSYWIKYFATNTILTIGGFESSRFTLTWGLLYLADHPKVQKRAQAEIDNVVGRGRLPTLKDRDDLPYTQAVLYEIMRAATVVSLGVAHAAGVDSTICGYDIPQNTTILINHWALHNDPKHWDQPEVFNPERFLTPDGKLAPTPQSWLPFSVGRRACLGESAAKQELLLIISVILHQFTLRLPPGVVADYSPESSGLAGYMANRYLIEAEKRV